MSVVELRGISEGDEGESGGGHAGHYDGGHRTTRLKTHTHTHIQLFIYLFTFQLLYYVISIITKFRAIK